MIIDGDNKVTSQSNCYYQAILTKEEKKENISTPKFPIPFPVNIFFLIYIYIYCFLFPISEIYFSSYNFFIHQIQERCGHYIGLSSSSSSSQLFHQNRALVLNFLMSIIINSTFPSSSSSSS